MLWYNISIYKVGNYIYIINTNSGLQVLCFASSKIHETVLKASNTFRKMGKFKIIRAYAWQQEELWESKALSYILFQFIYMPWKLARYGVICPITLFLLKNILSCILCLVVRGFCSSRLCVIGGWHGEKFVLNDRFSPFIFSGLFCWTPELLRVLISGFRSSQHSINWS